MTLLESILDESSLLFPFIFYRSSFPPSLLLGWLTLLVPILLLILLASADLDLLIDFCLL